MNTGEHNTEQEDNYWAQRVQDKKDGELQERARWVAAVEGMIKEYSYNGELTKEARYTGASALRELLTRMEAPA